jgi:dipeptidase D
MTVTFSVPEPKVLWKHFFDLVRVPRPSKHEQAAIEHLAQWAGERGFACRRDGAGNLAVFVPATTPGARRVMLQSHVDIVAVTDAASPARIESGGIREVDAAKGLIPMERGHFDPANPKRLKLDPEGDWINSPWTTLGADNGIGVAMMMTLAEAKERLVDLQLLFTIDEEAGMTGAGGLDPQALGLDAEWLINIDTEDDDEITIGSAGGRDVELRWQGEWASPLQKGDGEIAAYRISLQGLKGGHSGVEIHQGRGNANRLIARCLLRLADVAKVSLCSLKGGQRRNAIPDACQAIFYSSNATESVLREVIATANREWNSLYAGRDSVIEIQLERIEGGPLLALTPDSTNILLNLLTSIPTGICEMTPEIPNLVESSCNMAIVDLMMGDAAVVICSVRGTTVGNLNDITESITSLAQLGRAKVTVSDGYPGWKPKLDSQLLRVARAQYQQLFREEPKVHAVHAGLECGLLSEKMPGMEMISIGPNIKGNHAVGERVQVSSVQKSYRFLEAILAQLATC